MIIDLERDETPSAFPADVCIVGAGAAGIVLAAELLRQGKRVLLLESGGSTIEPAAQALNDFLYSGQPHRGANIGRFRALGGTTTAWGGQVSELDEDDFAPRPWISGSGWPFSKKELIPYYRRALAAEGLAQALPSDREVWQRMKVLPPDLGEDFVPYFTRWCPEPNFARLYRETFRASNICVVLHATATAMLLTEDGSRVRGIRCRTLEGREHNFTAAQYVFCLGTIESVRFLLQPLPGAQIPPWNRSGVLGRHFQSHIDFNAVEIPSESAHPLRRFFANAYLGGYKYHPKFRLSSAAQKREEALNIAGSITSIYGKEQDLERLKFFARNLTQGRIPPFEFADLTRILRQARTVAALGYGYAVEHRAVWPQPSKFWLRVHCEQEPLSASCITLTDMRDATGLFRAKLDWRISGLEWHSIQLFAERIRHVFIAHEWGEIVAQPELAGPRGYDQVTFDNSHHDMGGTRMAASAAQGVVDPQLRLHGVDNAYVCSASVFPTSGFSNPTHTLIALAIRLADHLKAAAHA